ncbi:MAG: hypothetical protein DRI90_17765 [Deltaproteobacteria bacterium]|nr:MAG: hypothetical protein DRI90_17765 [Deltaproteobacteria bacterium]
MGKLHWIVLSLPACATLADTGGGDVNMPNAAAGPFREITTAEIGNSRVAPYGLRDDDEFPRDVTVVDVDGEPDSLEVFAYVARTDFDPEQEPDPTVPPNEIVRHTAVDGRSFERQSDLVLAPVAGWEGDTVGAPAALRVGDEIWLYYAGAGGIGLATSSDGLTFQRDGDGLVFGPPASGWDQGSVPTSPAVVQLPDGTFQLFYQAATAQDVSAIGEAVSADGRSWERLGDGPVLAATGASADRSRPHLDALSVAAPCVVMGESSQGRTIQWVYYAAVGETGKRTIALAGRYGFVGPLSRAASPVFGTTGSLEPTEPWVMVYPGFSLLFVTEKAGSTESLAYPAVAIGVAPADITLSPPDPS